MSFHKLAICSLALILATSMCSCGDDDSGSGSTPQTPASAVTLKADPAELSFGCEGGSATVAVTTSGEWDAVAADSWLSIKKQGTLQKAGTVEVTATPNGATAARTGTVALLCGAARATITVSQQGREPEPVDESIEVPSGYTLVWHDEFDGTALNTADWTHEVQGPGWVNNELQTYVNGSVDGQPVTEVADGRLRINCLKHPNGRVYSGRIYAQVNTGWKYGIFEARIKLPKGKGTWPAFWMMPVNNDFSSNPWPRCGEIDIMEEVGYHPNYTSSSIHCASYNHVMNTQKTAERLTQGAEDDFHVYRLEWTAEYIRTYVDGTPLLTFNNDGTNNLSTWPFNRPFYLILNLAWGGDWGGSQGVDESALPATMEVDYVRVFQVE